MPCHVMSNLDWTNGFCRFLKNYEDGLPESRYLSTELAMWDKYCYHIVGTPPKVVAELLQVADSISLLNVMTAFGIFRTIPVNLFQ